MTPLTTDDFPYTLSYVMELLGLEERELMSFVQTLGLSPRKDEKTGRVIFTHRDIEAIKKARELKKSGELTEGLAQPVSINKMVPGQNTAASAEEDTISPTGKSGYMSPMSGGSSQSLRNATSGKDNITVMVEAVSQVKEGILKDLSRLLDDKLSGLDEVVVELIRCKSENDSLKKKLDEAVRAKETLEYELSRFKPVQFGFFRKT
ncbi:MerR family transcriptional regulator [Vampirovibrio chlorellavorus]|uniref:MerR family transcriptional regulator n=1 Tax=Vampirovibrio chlorellavorus TaxID=758823 RepID=UPI0026F2F199|nr:MerR family transcriptional regulator [Vampirovibrio chlorellavorus]